MIWPHLRARYILNVNRVVELSVEFYKSYFDVTQRALPPTRN